MLRQFASILFFVVLVLSVSGCRKEAAGSLRVIVANPDGPLQGVVVSLDPGGSTMTTDSVGIVVFNDIAPLDYLVSAAHPELGTAAGLISVQDEQTAGLLLLLRGLFNRPPLVDLRSPNNDFNDVFRAGDDLFFYGTAADDRDDLTALTVRWTSSRDGELFSERLNVAGVSEFIRNDLSLGDHLIRFRVTDSEGLANTDSIAITVQPALPVPTITSIEPEGSGLRISWEEWIRNGDFEYQLFRHMDGDIFEQLIFTSSDPAVTSYLDEGITFNKDARYFLNIHVPGQIGEGSATVAARVNLPAITLQNTVVALTLDPQRPYLYALDQTANRLLFISTSALAVESSLFVGSEPKDLSFDLTGDSLYVVAAGSNRIVVVDLVNRRVHRYLPLPRSLAGAGHVEYLAGGYLAVGAADFNVADVHLVRATDGELLDTYRESYFGMLTTSGRDALFTYANNSSGSQLLRLIVGPTEALQLEANQTDDGFGSKWLSLSTDGDFLVYNQTKYRAGNLSVVGQTTEGLYAINKDGSRAIGTDNIWDTETFTTLGPARIRPDFSAYDALNNRVFSHEIFSNLILVSPF
jgi:hypothetical protein